MVYLGDKILVSEGGMNIDDVLKQLELKENLNGVENLHIGNIPVWELVKHPLRQKYLVLNGGSERLPNATWKFRKHAIVNFISSFGDLIILLFSTKKYSNLIMGFSRFEQVNGLYIDKYIDPILELSNIGNDYIYIEYGQLGNHVEGRNNINNRYFSDFILFISSVIGIIITPIIFFCNKKDIYNTCDILTKCLGFNVGKRYVTHKVGIFKVQYMLYEVILKRHKTKRVFGVSRILFKSVAFAAKRLDIKVYELQHGITLARTALYMGPYNKNIDPDYFLLFGDSCPNDVFGIPAECTIKIGWAFYTYLAKLKTSNMQNNSCLLISSVNISDRIIEVAIKLSDNYPEMAFSVRRHPQEIYSEKQQQLLKDHGIVDLSSSECSAAALMPHSYIIGESSSVLYEALSIGKKVARLNICGLKPDNRKDNDGFYYIDDISDFKMFIKSPMQNIEKKAYTDFDVSLFNSLLNNN